MHGFAGRLLTIHGFPLPPVRCSMQHQGYKLTCLQSFGSYPRWTPSIPLPQSNLAFCLRSRCRTSSRPQPPYFLLDWRLNSQLLLLLFSSSFRSSQLVRRRALTSPSIYPASQSSILSRSSVADMIFSTGASKQVALTFINSSCFAYVLYIVLTGLTLTIFRTP